MIQYPLTRRASQALTKPAVASQPAQCFGQGNGVMYTRTNFVTLAVTSWRMMGMTLGRSSTI